MPDYIGCTTLYMYYGWILLTCHSHIRFRPWIAKNKNKITTDHVMRCDRSIQLDLIYLFSWYFTICVNDWMFCRVWSVWSSSLIWYSFSFECWSWAVFSAHSNRAVIFSDVDLSWLFVCFCSSRDRVLVCSSVFPCVSSKLVDCNFVSNLRWNDNDLMA